MSRCLSSGIDVDSFSMDFNATTDVVKGTLKVYDALLTVLMVISAMSDVR